MNADYLANWHVMSFGYATCESSRLRALYDLAILDTPPSESFDRITRTAAQLFGLPIAAVSLTDSDRQWFKSRVGVEHWSIPRERAPCAQVAETADLVVIPDLKADSCYTDSLLASQGIRFYAGASLTTRDGHSLGALCVLGNTPRQITEMEAAALKDLAAMAMAQIELQHAVGRSDPLTSLPNRAQLSDDLDDASRERHGLEQTAVFVDLAPPETLADGMRVLGPGYVEKMVLNASPHLRHAAGAAKLYHVSATQFMVLVSSQEDAKDLASKFDRALTGTQREPAVRLVSRAAIGLFAFRLGCTSASDIVRSAYSAALDARAVGSAIGDHSETSDRAHSRRFSLLHDFGAALHADDQLRLVVQPRVSLHTGRPVAAEMLLRWHHPLFGDVPPGEFIPLIEQSSLARPMTDWVLANSVEAAARQLGPAGLITSINISTANLDEEDLVGRVLHYLRQHTLPPELIEIEVTESAAVGASGTPATRLREFTDSGIRVAIDDFGTGYSNLAYLHELPAQVIKIDRAFTASLPVDARTRSVLVSMIELFRTLDYHIVAEGVEDAKTAKLLAAMGCDEAQGFYYARPIELSELNVWLRGRLSQAA